MRYTRGGSSQAKNVVEFLLGIFFVRFVLVQKLATSLTYLCVCMFDAAITQNADVALFRLSFFRWAHS